MNKLPITLVLFSSSKGHFGHKGVYKTTLDHLNRQLPLSSFGQLVAHVKVSPSEEAIAADMVADLESRGFKVLTTIADWTRGMSHQQGYTQDIATISKERSVYTQPYVLWLEDDSTIESTILSVEDLLLQSCQFLADDHEKMTVRVARKGDARGPEIKPSDSPNWFYSGDVNFQPMIMRSSDFYRLGMVLEANPGACATVQCEMLARMIIDTFSRSPRKHIVYETETAHSTHLGLPNYLDLKQSLNL